jgi:hypothetical protein
MIFSAFGSFFFCKFEVKKLCQISTLKLSLNLCGSFFLYIKYFNYITVHSYLLFLKINGQLDVAKIFTPIVPAFLPPVFSSIGDDNKKILFRALDATCAETSWCSFALKNSYHHFLQIKIIAWSFWCLIFSLLKSYVVIWTRFAFFGNLLLVQPVFLHQSWLRRSKR